MAIYVGDGGGSYRMTYMPNARPNGGRPTAPQPVQPRLTTRYYAPVTPRPRTLYSVQRQPAQYRPVVTATGNVGGAASAPGGRFEAFGITPEWMKAYREFWGQPLPEKLWGLVNPLTSLFARYMQRLPQLDDWRRVWQSVRDQALEQGQTLKHMPQDLAVYEPVISRMVRQPLFTPPNISYSPTLTF